MPTYRQTIAAKKREKTTLKRAIIGRVTGAAMHILHGADIYGSELWPALGFQAGFCTVKFTDDIVFIGAQIFYSNDDTVDQDLLLNFESGNYKLLIQQAPIIDTILENAIYDNILFSIDNNPLRHNRYYITTSGTGEVYYCQLRFKFTIND